MQQAVEERSWEPFFQAVERRVGKEALETWFRPLSLTRPRSDQVLRISAPNRVVRDWILSHYSQTLDASLNELNLAGCRIEWTILSGNTNAATGYQTRPTSQADGLSFHSARMLRNDQNISSDTPKEPLFVPDPCVLNLNYTFETFVVGSSNRFAHAAARTVAEAPGKSYNPLYLFGPVGLGKTHLMQAIGHAIRSLNPKLKVCYVSVERFMNELITAIRYGHEKTSAFRERYRSTDILLIDDIQFISGKERTQDEFFHTFNALYDKQKQIVLSSDCGPRQIAEIEERLHSRFEWGLIADIEPPDLETKVAIVKRKAELQHIALPDDVARFLASSSKHNIRELEGSLIRLLAISSLRGVPLSITLAQEAVPATGRCDEDPALSIGRIQKTVAAYYKIDSDKLIARSNSRHISLPRQVAMYLCKRLTKNSYPEIARQFGGKHHTTVMHSVEKISRLITSDSDFRELVNKLIENLKSD